MSRTQAQLGDVLALSSGGTPSKANAAYWNGTIPWVSCKDMKVERLYDAQDHLTELGAGNGTRLVEAGTILFVVRGMILAGEFPIARVMRPVAFNQDLKAVTPKPGVSADYLYYLLKAKTHEILGIADEAAHGTKRLQTDRLLALQVEVPSRDEQQRVAEILRTYDDLIENNTRRIGILEDMARSLYREWFVNFRFPGHENVEMVELLNGVVPKGWRAARIGDEVELAYGKALRADERADGSVPVYGSSGVVGYHSAALVDGPGVIVGRKGNVGSVHWSDYDFYAIDTVFYVKTGLSLFYVFFNFQSQNFINNDAAVPGLNRNQAYSLPLLVPDHATLDAFDAWMCPVFAQVRNLRERNVVLKETRDLLLPRLISGELDLSSLDIDAGELSA